MPKVSIILPNYNHALYLEHRIQSILEQTYQDFELIYLDDASTDHSNQVFAQYAEDSRIQAIFNQINSGSPFKQWNKGVRRATGEYIWIAESDDYSDPQQLEVLVNQLEQNPSVGLAYCQSWRVDSNNQTIGKCRDYVFHPEKARWEHDFVNSGTVECSQYMTYENAILNASSVLIRRSVYEQVGFADEGLRLCGDWILWLKILLISDVAYVSQPLNYYRSHEGTVRRQSDLSGLSVEENYRVVAFILEHVDFRSYWVDKALKKFFDKWVDLLLSDETQITWSRNLEIYKIARYVDQKLHYRIIQTLTRIFLERCHLIKPARQVVRFVKQCL
jgi:glycosyltransferase involved in cell wall biosynthesis